MTPDEFRASLSRLRLTQAGAGIPLGSDARTIRRWASGERGIPPTVVILLKIYEHDRTLMNIARDALRARPEQTDSSGPG